MSLHILPSKLFRHVFYVSFIVVITGLTTGWVSAKKTTKTTFKKTETPILTHILAGFPIKKAQSLISTTSPLPIAEKTSQPNTDTKTAQTTNSGSSGNVDNSSGQIANTQTNQPTQTVTNLPTSALPSPTKVAINTIVPTPTSNTPTPTTAPTTQPANTATISADAVYHPGNSDQVVYNGIVRVKDTVSGEILASGTTNSGGRIEFYNVPANRNVDMILLQPTDWVTQYCGDKQSFYLSAGQFKTILLRIRPQGSTPCEH